MDEKETETPMLPASNKEQIEILPTDGGHEPGLIKHNQGKIAAFRRFGFFLIYWKRIRYEISNRMIMLYYLICYFGAFAIFGLAYGIREIFKQTYSHEYKDKIDDLIEAAMVVIFLGICPSIWNYLLREYNTHLPLILISIKKLETNNMYQKLGVSEDPTVSYQEGFQDEDHTDADDEIYIETQKSIKQQSWFVKYGPYIGALLSFVACSVLVLVNLVWNIIISISEVKDDETFKHLIKDLPSFIASVLFPLPCYASIWFCIFFIEWQKNVYSDLRHHIRTIKKSHFDANTEMCKRLSMETKEELKNIWCMVVKLQKVFTLLNKKIFQKSVVINFTMFIFLDIYCSYKVIEDHTNYVYILPLLLVNFHTYVLCKWSNDLMSEFNEIMEILNEMHEEDIEHLRREFNESPPQVMGFGGFSVNYSMMTAVLAFALSIISISGMIWPELGKEDSGQKCYEYTEELGVYTVKCSTEICYQYQDSEGANVKLCVPRKDRIDIVWDSTNSNKTGNLDLTILERKP